MRRRAVVLAALLALAVAPIFAFQAQQLDFGTQLNAAACNAAGGKLVINIVQSVTGDIDSGTAGQWWAYDEYNRHIQVWQLSDDSFCALVKYTGSFTTVGGASPGGSGTVAAGVTGTMEGGYRATFTGTLKPAPLWKTKGNVGLVDYACDASEGQASCSYVSWTGQYFDSVASFDQVWWGWIYQGGNNGSWVNSIEGNSGDITGNP